MYNTTYYSYMYTYIYIYIYVIPIYFQTLSEFRVLRGVLFGGATSSPSAKKRIVHLFLFFSL